MSKKSSGIFPLQHVCYILVFSVVINAVGIVRKYEDYYEYYAEKEATDFEYEQKLHLNNHGTIKSDKNHINNIVGPKKSKDNEKLNKIVYRNFNLSSLSPKKEKIYIDKKSNWPKFEELLRTLGKRYDWKSDRWIKVKRKLKDPANTELKVTLNHLVHPSHNFSFSTVRLRRKKNRRNVIVAVTIKR